MRHLTRLPWWAKIFAKLSLSLLPGSYEKIRETITGSHGNMEDPEFARRIFERFLSLYKKHNGSGNGDKVLLELGPGGNLATGLLARLAGFENSILIDVGDFALKDLDYYAKLLASLSDSEYAVSRLPQKPASFHQMSRNFSISYKTGGLSDLRQIPPKSVDFVFSNSVLEHVRVTEFRDTCRELYRVQKENGVACHHVDFKDHLGGRLNHFRFPSRLWEKEWIARAGFYTNRIGFEQMLEIFRETGFDVVVRNRTRWDNLPIRKEKLAREFRRNSMESLLTKGAMFVLKK